MSAPPCAAALLAKGLRLPQQNSRAEQVLAALRDGPCSVEQGILRHTDFGLPAKKVRLIYEGLVDMGCADVHGLVYSSSVQLQRYYGDLERVPEVAFAGQVAGPRYCPGQKPLNTAATRMPLTRDGALDYRSVPSLMGSVRKLPNGEIVK
jgi:hypothetical protein